MDKAHLMSMVESMVVEVVNIIFNLYRPDIAFPLDVKDLYLGDKSIPLSRICARGFTFYVLHDSFFISYTTMAKRSGLSSRSVIRNVKHTRERVFIDTLYKAINDLIKERLIENKL